MWKGRKTILDGLSHKFIGIHFRGIYRETVYHEQENRTLRSIKKA